MAQEAASSPPGGPPPPAAPWPPPPPYPYYPPVPPRQTDDTLPILIIILVAVLVIIPLIIGILIFFAFAPLIPSFPTSRPQVTFADPSDAGGNVSVPILSVSARHYGPLFRIAIIWNGNASPAVDVTEAPSFEVASVFGTRFRISWVDVDGDSTVSNGDAITVGGDGLPLPAGDYTLNLLWRLDGTVLASVDWTGPMAARLFGSVPNPISRAATPP